MNFQEAINDLQVLDVQRPGTWPTWVHFAAAVLTAVVLVGGGTYFKLMPMRDELREAREKETALFSEFERKQKKVVALDAYKAQLQEMERTFGAMLKQLPSRSEVANLLNDISQTRVASSLDEELFQPLTEQPKDFYAEIPNKIIVIGSYHEMGAFVSGVAALPRIVTVDEVEIRAEKPVARGANSLNPENLRMTAVAKTYRYLDEDELAAADAAKKAAQRGGGK
ncbi:type IV pilus assembly protein PilO [Panacagrimonas perspica]|uniref:Type IV pilus assembly protein PilO n=1 Tax=Panacagrimonas perspica TaxID=381431 RepID=A0A4S3K065_9GAMM|nr:type 4a pilus biogenesis protein PilO [Panacagrimonas perspica]TDU28196.1 type IV pilus assembly protein PilO [Panacagrimonas perspica]THD01283.1 pilus assembly protein PilO [Panacagrimonas perspica]